MPLKIVRNDITKMNTEAIVNTANSQPLAADGCDTAVYKAAGYNELLKYRQEKIGVREEGDVFVTPGFKLFAKYIIHAVSPLFKDGNNGEENKLRQCYSKSLNLAREMKIKSIAFPLIATGSFSYPKEEGIRIAVDEINAFLLENTMDIYLVVFDEKSTSLGKQLYPDLKSYIDRHMVQSMSVLEYPSFAGTVMREESDRGSKKGFFGRNRSEKACPSSPRPVVEKIPEAKTCFEAVEAPDFELDSFMADDEAYNRLKNELSERILHKSDTFSEYLLYLIKRNGMENDEVYKGAVVDKKLFSKIKNNPDYHPQKITALCLCVGAKLSLDDTKDLLSRAGYALSPSDMTDIIFSFFIEHEHYDIVDIDIQLEEYGLPCIIS